MSAPLHRNPDRSAWLIAWALALMLHAALIVGLRHLPSPAPVKAAAPPEPIRLVFKSAGPGERTSAEPRAFTELPPDRRDSAPKHADFLSNVTSQARDRVPGGDQALPRMQGDADFPTVKLESGGAPSPSASRPQARPQPEPTMPRAAEPPPRGSVAEQAMRVPPAATLAKPGERDTVRLFTDATSRESNGAAGNSDIDQPETANPGGNAALTGDVSLNTTAWEYAPWLQRFGRRLMHQWAAPPAYNFGILKEGGWAVIEMEISRSGRVLRLDLQEQQGHPSLILAAQSALRSMDPVERLPADFPEPTLILRIRMIYPRIRSR